MRQFRRDIEGLRAIAVVAVVLYHAGVPGTRGGFVGVDVFFVISGFLITGQLLHDDEQYSAVARIRRFYARRMRRIVPAATLTIVVSLAAAAVVQPPLLQRAARLDGIAAMFFFSNIRFAHYAADYFHQGAAPSLFQHFWSLSVEEQFYVAWPALIVGSGVVAFARRRSVRVGLVAAVFVASLAASVALRLSDPVHSFYLLPTRAWELAAGALLTTIGRPFALPARVVIAARAAGLVLIAAAVATFDRVAHFPGYAALVPVAGAALVIAAGTFGDDVGDRSPLAQRPMQLLGRYSYSWYLWHWPVLVLVGLKQPDVLTDWKQALGIMVVAALPIAVASYHAVEHPFRTRFTRRPDRDSLLAGGAILCAGAVFLALFGPVAMGDLATDRTAAPPTALTPTAYVPANLRPSLEDAYTRGNEARRSCRGQLQPCVLGDPAATTTIVVYGDSHTLHWLGAFDAAGRASHWRIVAFVKPGCPAFLHPAVLDGVNCRPFRVLATRFIQKSPPNLVVFSNSSLLALDELGARMDAGVRGAIAALPANVPVAVFAQTPSAPDNVPVCLSAHLRATQRCEPHVGDAAAAAVNVRLRAALAGTRARLVDVDSLVCSGGRCPAVIGNVLVYRDDDHVTYDFARTRGPEMARLLAPLLSTPTLDG
jgi:peptidoglycan/LPS O-acetylase OafA/YrhL